MATVVALMTISWDRRAIGSHPVVDHFFSTQSTYRPHNDYECKEGPIVHTSSTSVGNRFLRTDRG